MHKTCITAHSGALQTKDNTFESIKAGLAFVGEGCIEVDVRFLPDGTPALDHDRVDQNSVKLEAVFELMQGYKGSINLDMKEHSNISAMVKLVDTYGLQGRAFMTGLSKDSCAALRDCGLPYYLNASDAKAAKELGAIGVNIFYKICSKRLVRRAREHGMKVSVWTVNKPRTMKKMLTLGVDNITTRCPDLLQEIMDDAL